MTKRVAIIGLAFRFPGTSTEHYWSDLLDGKNLITEVDATRWSDDAYLHPDKNHPGTAYTRAAGSLGDVSQFDADFFGISPREASLMDPQQRLLLEMSWEALENAGVKPTALRGSDCGVYIGISSADYAYRISEDLGAIDASTATGNTASIAANRLSYFFDLRGPSIALDTACSSSMVAFHQACRAIQSGECSHALTGGISLHLHPYGFITFSKASMLSPSGQCNVFDASGDGYVRSEGGGIFLLKDYDKALADGDRILAVVAATGVNTDGRKAGLTVPSAEAQAELLRHVYAQAGISPADLDYLEAHGTGTSVGDPIETRAIGAALGKRRAATQPLPIGSVKSNLGHLEPASGVAGLVKAIYALNHRLVPATIGVRNLNPNIAFKDWNIEVTTQNRPLKPSGKLTIGVNSFGFGGANAHVILESPPAVAEPPATKLVKNAPVPLIVSGKTQAALRDAAAAMARRLRQDHGHPLYDLAYHAALRRDWHAHRALVFASDRQGAADDLQSLADGTAAKYRVATETLQAQARGPVFVYSGNGSQWAGMGKRLMADPVFASAVHEVDALFSEYADFSPAAELSSHSANERYDFTEIAQPTLFALQVGITRMLAQRGVVPVATMGHSVGEVAAVWACGALSLPDAVRVIYHRSRLQGLTKGKGRMTAVGISAAETDALIAELKLGRGLSLAGANSYRGATVAGDPALLDALEAVLSERSIFHRRLNLDYAFHSAAMDPIEGGIQQSLAGITPRDADIPFYSSVSGQVEPGRTLNAAYWWRNVRLPVLFEPASASAIADGLNVFVEIGPHPVLRGYLKDALHTAGTNGRILITASRGSDDPEKIHDVAGQLILSGADVNWQALFPWTGEHTDLPAYPWQRERHWHAVTPESPMLLTRKRVHPLLGYRHPQQQGLWENQLDTLQQPSLADHVVGEATVFPGTGFAELALAAALQWRPGHHADIEELEIRAPLLLGAAPSKRLRFELDEADGRFRIQSREQGSEEPWTPHATGRIRQEAGPIGLAQITPLALPSRAPDFDHDAHERLTRAVGLDYGPAFRAIAHGWHESAGSVLAVLQPDACLDDELSRMHLHPALLDCSFQLIIQLLKDDPAIGQGIAFVPSKIGRLCLHAGQGQPKYARARLRQRAPHSLTADFELFDAQGRALASVREARFRSIRLSKGAGEHLDFVDCVLTPRPHPLAPATDNPLHTAALVRDIERMLETTASRGGERYAQEVDPLLESLCDRLALEALRAQTAGGPTLSAALVERRLRRSPQTAALLEHLLQRCVAAGFAQSAPTGWTLAADEEGQPTAADIWNSLLREYPDYFPAIYAAGRVGLHLPALLQGKTDIDAVIPRAVTPTAISRLLLGAELGQQLAAVLAQAARRAVARLASGQRLAILEIAQGAPIVGPACCAALDFGVADYCYASPDSQAVEDARHALLDSYPDAGAVLLGDDAGAQAQARYDLIIVHCEFDTQQTCLQALAYARASLKPDGKLLLRGTHPSQWLDFVFGGRPEWWQGSDNLTALPPASRWQQWLQEQGLACEPEIELTGSPYTGAYLLLASLPQAAPAAPATEARSQLILASASGPDLGLGQALHAELQFQGQHSMLATGTHAAQLDALIQDALNRHGPLHDILLLDGWGADSADDASRLQAQIARCALAAGLIQACERSGAAATVWIVTRNAGVSMGGGQPQDPAIGDAAVWGYGRTLANEASNYRIRLADLPHSAAAVAALAREIRYPDAEDEVLFGAGGERHAPRLRVVERPRPDSAGAAADNACRLGFTFPGQLRNLRWESYAAPEPADDQIEVRIHATGLNFRDVMYSLGLLSDEAIENGFAGPTLGLEFSGVVSRVGSAVTDYRAGDAVVGFGPASFGDRVLTRASAISRIPANFSFEAAATLPSTFFTVYYALHHLAHLQEGEKILIHGAAGGVGIAAIQLAQWLGADIYATAGSEEKRDFLRMMGVSKVYDSRSLAYADEILADTGGVGVDVVLNSLAGEAINRNLQVLRPFGRFLELGKRDFYENTRIGLRPFRNNISYFGIDADQLMNERPDLTRRLFGEMMQLFSDGALHPLPYTVFDANEVVDAFRYMQQARQIGKIVVTYRHGIRRLHRPAGTAPPPLRLTADASYLVTGGLGGFGLRTAQWLVEKGARHLILISRRGPHDDHAKEALAAFKAAGVQVHAAACDVTDRKALLELLAHTRRSMPPLRGLVHAAVVIDDGLARNANAAQIERTLSAKVLGAYHLHTLTRETELDFCVYYSSATTLFGNPGQSNYVAANMWLEALAMHRRAIGLPATCVRWGAIDDVGFLARNEKIRDALQTRMGGSALPSSVALAALESLLLTHRNGLGVLELDWHALNRFLPSSQAPKFSGLARRAGDSEHEGEQGNDIAHLLATLDEPALHAAFGDMLKAEIGEILRVSADKIDPERSIYDMGLDSLMGVELIVALENRFGIRLPVMALSESPTVNKLASRLILLLRGETADSGGDHVASTVEKLVADHAADVSPTAINAFVADLKSGEAEGPQRMIQ
ncbi:type I polyketide synthase [Bordetella genomosp. 12]|uniref:Beta-ketoacyl synthase n=1 Tax=Bordetella genomosp. 12 TaxID=463035 RepID=A0A261VV54_9BORD|nr:type I polyketide synthase [Bordetella genomosp. 12]OZI77651.1 beta-ketoacyl synthase [Bordetella genomosp. 12]